MKISKKHSRREEKRLTSKAATSRRPEEAPPVPPPVAVPQSDPYLVAGFDLLWAVIPKRISTGAAMVEAFAVWKTLKPVPNRRHVAEMVRLLGDYLEEETDYAFYEVTGEVKVTPAMLIVFLCKAMGEGSSLAKVVEEVAA